MQTLTYILLKLYVLVFRIVELQKRKDALKTDFNVSAFARFKFGADTIMAERKKSNLWFHLFSRELQSNY